MDSLMPFEKEFETRIEMEWECERSIWLKWEFELEMKLVSLCLKKRVILLEWQKVKEHIDFQLKRLCQGLESILHLEIQRERHRTSRKQGAIRIPFLFD